MCTNSLRLPLRGIMAGGVCCRALGPIFWLLRLFIGLLVGALRMPFLVLPALYRRKCPPPFVTADSLGADAVAKAHANEYHDVFFNSADGTQLHAVEDLGARRVRGRRPLIFVHGWPELWISWLPQLNYFVNLGHPVLALSMRGYGLSDKPRDRENYDLNNGTVVGDIRAAVAHASRGNSLKPLLIAHDWGAGVCWAYVSQSAAEQLVAGYVSLSNPPTEAMINSLASCCQAWASLYMIFFNAPVLPELCLTAAHSWLAGLILADCKRGMPEPAVLNAYRTNCSQPGAMTCMLNYYRAALNPCSSAVAEHTLGPTNRLLLPV